MKKRFEELSNLEIRALKVEDLKEYVDLECIYQQIPFLDELKERKDKYILEINDNIKGFRLMPLNLVFSNWDDAKKIADVLGNVKTVKTKNVCSWDFKGINSDDLKPEYIFCSEDKFNKIVIEEVSFCSEAEYKEFSDNYEKNKIELSEYAREKSDYYDNQSKISAIRNEIKKLWDIQCKINKEIKKLEEDFVKYFEITSDEIMTFKFLITGYKGTKDSIEEFLFSKGKSLKDFEDIYVEEKDNDYGSF